MHHIFLFYQVSAFIHNSDNQHDYLKKTFDSWMSSASLISAFWCTRNSMTSLGLEECLSTHYSYPQPKGACFLRCKITTNPRILQINHTSQSHFYQKYTFMTCNFLSQTHSSPWIRNNMSEKVPPAGRHGIRRHRKRLSLWIQYLWSVVSISFGVSFFLSIDRQTYHI